MRELKFRAWDKRTNQMYPVANISFGDDGSARTIMAELAPKGQYYNAVVHGENGILMQFTGLQDAKGRDIYEGDIVKHVGYESPFEMHVVDWEDDRYCLSLWDKGTLYPTCYALTTEIGTVPIDMEVVGNIYGHPELMEGNSASNA